MAGNRFSSERLRSLRDVRSQFPRLPRIVDVAQVQAGLKKIQKIGDFGGYESSMGVQRVNLERACVVGRKEGNEIAFPQIFPNHESGEPTMPAPLRAAIRSASELVERSLFFTLISLVSPLRVNRHSSQGRGVEKDRQVWSAKSSGVSGRPRFSM